MRRLTSTATGRFLLGFAAVLVAAGLVALVTRLAGGPVGALVLAVLALALSVAVRRRATARRIP